LLFSIRAFLSFSIQSLSFSYPARYTIYPLYFLCVGEERRISHRHGLGFTYTAQKVVYISKNIFLRLNLRQDFGFYYSALLAFTIQVLAFTIQKCIPYIKTPLTQLDSQSVRRPFLVITRMLISTSERS
jgi:hypothetical protein